MSTDSYTWCLIKSQLKLSIAPFPAPDVNLETVKDDDQQYASTSDSSSSDEEDTTFRDLPTDQLSLHEVGRINVLS